MKQQSDLLYYDFQGWPLYKASLREILEALVELNIVEKLQNAGVDKYVIRADNPYLDKYPKIMHDDGMGYATMTEYISDVDNSEDELRFWVDQKVEENE